MDATRAFGSAAKAVDALVTGPSLAPAAGGLSSSLLRAVQPDGTLVGSNWSDVLSRGLPTDDLKLLAAAAARVVAYGVTAIPETERPALLKRLADILAKPLRLEDVSMSFEIERAVCAAVKDLEGMYDQLAGEPITLAASDAFRASLTRLLRRGDSAVLVGPFMPQDLLRMRLDEVFKLIEEYRSSDGSSKVEKFRIARDATASYSEAARAFGTSYSSRFLAGSMDRLTESLDRDFEQSAYSKAAALDVLEPRKKAPLGIQGVTIELVLPIVNGGLGEASDVQVLCEESDTLVIDQAPTFVGRVGLDGVEVSLSAGIRAAAKSAIVTGRVTWSNHDGSQAAKRFIVEIAGQREDIQWDDLADKDPYSLDPVEHAGDLVGREDVLGRMFAEAGSRNVGSMFVFGQKRVGKTSVVKILESKLLRRFPDDYAVVYLEGGDYVHHTAETTLRNLGVGLCDGLKRQRNELADIPTPEFRDSLTPLGGFLQQVSAIAPELRCLFILDEFDALPIALYKRGPVGDAFFLTLRSVSGKKGFGFCLVGGERMVLINSAQGHALNRYQPMPLDYFDKSIHWRDFVDLVRRPVEPWLEYSDDAVSALYEISAGNPFFTKLVCRSLLALMIERRDAHITAREVEEARRSALRTIQANAFQHFWEDGILEAAESLEAISIDRRKMLLAWADALRETGTPNEPGIVSRAQGFGLTPEAARKHLQDFTRRKILEARPTGYQCVVSLFGDWLVERGPTAILTDFMDPAAVARLRQNAEAEYVRSEEIVSLVEPWGTYRGARIGEDPVRAWLNQFDELHDRRLMFQLLQGIRFVGRSEIRELLREGNEIVRRGIVFQREKGQRRVREIAVSYVDGAGKSGASYASLYAEENGILAERVIEKSALERTLARLDEVQALVFVDDFLGTGSQAVTYLEELKPILEKVLAKPGVKAYFLAIAGFGKAQDRVKDHLESWQIPVEVRVLKPMGEADRLFSDSSMAFPDPAVRLEAEAVARSYGSRIVASHPLGFEGLGARVVFESSIPNNDPPILWSNGKGWKPLFERF